MSRIPRKEGQRWVEERFNAIAEELGVTARLDDPAWGLSGNDFLKNTVHMAYYVGEERRTEIFRFSDLENAGAGDNFVRNKLTEQIRRLLQGQE